MSFLGHNIRKIRTVKKLSQASFAEIFGLSRANIASYEEQRAEAKIDTVLSIAKYFGISVETLLDKELAINDIYNFEAFKHEFAQQCNSTGEKKKKNCKTKPTPFIAAGDPDRQQYIKNLDNRQFIDTLPSFVFPGIQAYESRAFEHGGNDMLISGFGIHEGDILICTPLKLQAPQYIEEDLIYVVITKENLMIRRITGKGKYLELKADNPDCSQQLLRIDIVDVVEIWKVYAAYSLQINEPFRLKSELSEIKQSIKDIHSTLKKM